MISTNVKALSGPIHLYNDLKRRRQRSNACYMSEVTVGGGLPIMSQLRSLINAGDEVVKIEGVFSAALSYLLNTLSTPLLAEQVTSFIHSFIHSCIPAFMHLCMHSLCLGGF